jgi:hypothetical protein
MKNYVLKEKPPPVTAVCGARTANENEAIAIVN